MTTVNSRPSHGIQYTVRCNAQICKEKIQTYGFKIYTLTTIGNKHYSHFNAQKHETVRHNVGGHALCCLPTKLLGTCARLPVSVPMNMPIFWPEIRNDVNA